MSINHKLLLDENLSWRVARALIRAGYDVITVSQTNLSGLDDHLVFQRAQQLQRVIVTRDSDFLSHFAPPHHGIIVLDCESTIGNQQIVLRLLETLPALLATDLADSISRMSISQ